MSPHLTQPRVAIAVACLACSGWLTPAARAQDPVESVRAVVQAGGDLSDSLAELQGRAEDAPRDVRVWVALGEAWQETARRWLAAGSSPSYALADAASAFDRALEIDPNETDALVGGWSTHYEIGNLARAATLAEHEVGQRLLSGDDLGPALSRALRARVLRFRSNTSMDPAERALEIAALHGRIERSRQLAPDSAAVTLAATDFYAAIDLPDLAFDLTLAALDGNAGDVSLHQRAIDLAFFGAAVDRLPRFYERLATAHPNSAVVLWYRGYVELLIGDAARGEQRYGEALAHYRRGRSQLREAADLEESYLPSARRIAFLHQLGEMWSIRGQGDLAGASALLLELLGRAADLRATPDGFQRTMTDGVATLCGDYEALREYPTAIALARAMTEVEPDNGEWWNNLGYFYREHATQIEMGWVDVEGDRKSAARLVYEQSWEAYQRAAELSANDARIVNDAALIQIYHLRTELERAVSMERASISTGEQQLVDLGDDPAEEERFPVAQAVGDAYENLGYLAYHVEEDLPKAKGFFERSIATDSGDRGNVRQYLEAIAGSREPIEENDPTSNAAPRPAARPRGQVTWEPSLAAAFDRAKAENRPVLVYFRGSALGLSIPFWDELMTSQRFADRVNDWVCVLASDTRNTIVDFARDGRRVASPTFGVVTCAEHREANREFLEWWTNNKPEAAANYPEEGLHLFAPDGSVLEMGQRLDFTQLAADVETRFGPPRDGLSLDALERTLRIGSTTQVRSAVGKLATTPGRAALDAVEQLSLDPSIPTEARRELIHAVGNSSAFPHLQWLTALIRQSHDEHARAFALEASTAAEAADVQRALAWSRSSSTRQRAARAAQSAAQNDSVRAAEARLICGSFADREAMARALSTSAESVGVLAARLPVDPHETVRVALCLALQPHRKTVQAVLETCAEQDASRRVRAAAARALRGETSDW